VDRFSGEVTNPSQNTECGKFTRQLFNMEKEILSQRLRIAEQDNTITKLVVTNMEQNINAKSLENMVMAQNIKMRDLENMILAQNIKMRDLENMLMTQNNDILGKRIEQMSLDRSFNESLQREIERREHLIEKQEENAKQIKSWEANHQISIQKNEEAIVLNRNQTKNEISEIYILLNSTPSGQEQFVGQQERIESRLNRTNVDLLKIQKDQGFVKKQINMCIEKQSQFESDMQEVENQTAILGRRQEKTADNIQ